MSQDKGYFITFEGIEGCGKTTQVALAGKYLGACGIPHLLTAEPGGTVLGEQIRRLILHETKVRMAPESELLLFSAARAQHVEEIIRPSLESGSWVLCDRFSDATVAYQGYGRGLDMDLICRLNRFSSRALVPDLTILFDTPVQTGLQRARSKTANLTGCLQGDRIEGEDLYFHQRVRDGYLRLAEREPARFRVVDGSKNIETIHDEVCTFLLALRP